ncbi:MAG: recombinase family protein [Solirubrobacteraceae bacterium]
MTTKRRAIGIIRVSQINGRDGDSFASPGEQRERIEVACERDGLQLVDVLEELDVSGGTPLENRAGLRSAIEAVEDGRAQVICAAYFDRLCRSLKVQGELIERVERAGGQVLAVDVGQVTNGSAGQWLSGTMLGAVAEYQRRTTAERTVEAQRRAVNRGVPPLATIPPGYRRGPDGRLVVEPREAPIVAEAFRMRADGATIKQVCAYMCENGIERTWRSTQSTLASRVVLGEINFGAMVNLEAHPPIVDAETFRRVQEMRVPRGRRPPSERLLARLGVLRCGTCGARLCAGSRSPGRYPVYRCPPTGDCPDRVTISAKAVEAVAVERVQEILSHVQGRASARQARQTAESALESAQDALDAAIRTLADFTDEPATRDKLAELRQVRDDARDRLDRLGPAPADLTVSADDWHLLSPEARRALIRALIESITVAPGRGTDRVTINAA